MEVIRYGRLYRVSRPCGGGRAKSGLRGRLRRLFHRLMRFARLSGHARRSNSDLIAPTTHGRGGLGRLVFGSAADQVLRKAPCPVLLVRATIDNKS
jgi:hypothetical protein